MPTRRTYGRVDLCPLAVRLGDNPRVSLVIRAVHLAWPVVATLLHPPASLARVRPEQELRVAPSVRPEDVTRLDKVVNNLVCKNKKDRPDG